MNGTATAGAPVGDDENPFLTAALAYAHRGWSVFPLHTPGPDGLCTCGAVSCQSPGKHPRTPAGLHDATGNPERIRDWWTRWPRAGIGVRTGRDFFCLDIDPRHGGEEALAALVEKYGPLPATRTHRTGGGGLHYLFRCVDPMTGKPVKISSSSGKIGPGLDVKGWGGYIVMPPSLHVSGGSYEILDDSPIADAPRWLFNLITSRGRSQAPRITVPERIREGQRNDTLFRLASSLRARGLSETAIREALHAENAAKCDPPLPRDEVDRIAESAGQYPAGELLPHNKDPRDRPKIIVTDARLRDISDLTLQYLIEANDPPHIFIRSGKPCRVVFNEKGIPVVASFGESAFKGILERTCNYTKLVPVKVDGKPIWKESPIAPPNDVVLDILNLPEWPFPALTGVTPVPIIHLADGTIPPPGYDPVTGMYFAPSPGFVLSPVPDNPTPDDVKAAVDLVNEPFLDFPFTDDASRAHIIAALLTAVLRPSLPGLVPITLIDKPAPGTGASLIARVISVITLGTTSAIITAPRGEEGWQKLVTSIVRDGSTLVNVDNIESKLQSAALAAIVTATDWRDRILGLSETGTWQNCTTWIVNGNNITLGGDLPRRVIWCRLDAQSERPWQEKREFKHPDLIGWTRTHRGDILAAVLTLVRYWIRSGKPKPPADTPLLGGFEEWRDTIGGILDVCGVPGFLGNLDALYEEMDLDGAQWNNFITTWHEVFQGSPVTVAELLDRITKERDSMCPEYGAPRKISEALPDDLAEVVAGGKGSVSKRIGNALRKRKDRIFSGGLRLELLTRLHGLTRWRVRPIKKQNTQTPKTDQGGEFGEFGSRPNTNTVTPQTTIPGSRGDLGDLDPRLMQELKSPKTPKPSQTGSHLGDLGDMGDFVQPTTRERKNVTQKYDIENGRGQITQTTQITHTPIDAGPGVEGEGAHTPRTFDDLVALYDLPPAPNLKHHIRFKASGFRCMCKGCDRPPMWHDLDNKVRPLPLCDEHYKELIEAARRDRQGVGS